MNAVRTVPHFGCPKKGIHRGRLSFFTNPLTGRLWEMCSGCPYVAEVPRRHPEPVDAILRAGHHPLKFTGELL